MIDRRKLHAVYGRHGTHELVVRGARAEVQDDRDRDGDEGDDQHAWTSKRLLWQGEQPAHQGHDHGQRCIATELIWPLLICNREKECVATTTLEELSIVGTERWDTAQIRSLCTAQQRKRSGEGAFDECRASDAD